MNTSTKLSASTEQAWQSVLGQLQMEMPRASFETWVRDTEAISLDDGVMTVSVRNAYARDWLESRLSSTVSRLLVGILSADVRVQFVVEDGEGDIPEEDTDEQVHQQAYSVEPEYMTHYQEVVKPKRVVMLDGYSLRLMEQGDMSPKDLSLWVGFRQAVYWSWKAGQGNVQNLAHYEITRFAMMSRAVFFRELKNATMISDRKFVAGGHVEILPQPADSDSYSNRYRVLMSPLLSRHDSALIESILAADVALTATREDASLSVLQTLTGLTEYDPAGWINQEVEIPEIQPRRIDEIVCRVLGITGDLDAEILSACEKLYDRIMQAFGKIVITHYFLLEVVPALRLTHPQTWAIIALRDRCWFDHETMTQKQFALVHGGIETVAHWLGVSKRSVEGWLKDPAFSAFVHMADATNLTMPEEWERRETQVFLVHQQEPVLSEEKVRLGSGKNETHSAKKRDSVLEKMRLDLRKSETLLNNLIKPLINLNKPQKTTTTVGPANTLSVEEQAAVDLPAAWVLDRILIQNRVHPKTQKAVRGASAKALVSWLLYALSPGGRGIDRPMNYALARLSEDPQSGAGDRYDELASLPPRALLQIADKASRGGLAHLLFTREEMDELADLWIEVMGTEKESALKLMRLLIGNKASQSVTRMTEFDRWEQTENGWQHTVETHIEE